MKIYMLNITTCVCMLTCCACSKAASQKTSKVNSEGAAKAAQNQPAKETPLPTSVEAKHAAPPQQIPPHIDRLNKRMVEMRKKNLALFELKSNGQLVGMRLIELEKLIGAPTTINDKSTIYRNDNGLGGWEWTLEVNDGIITSVQERSLD